MNKKIIYTSPDKQRLDVYLTDNLDKSRSQIKKMILAGFILVNNKPARVHEFLKENDEILITTDEHKVISNREQVTNPLSASNHPKKNNSKDSVNKKKKNTFLQKVKSLFNKKNPLAAFSQEPKVIKENKDYLIIEKPAGMLVHPTLRNETDTLVDWLLIKYPDIKGVGEDPSRPGLVHRLDKAVSGLMVIARNLDSFEDLKQQFKLRTIEKNYTALAHGVIDNDTGLIDFSITRSKSGQYVALPLGSSDGKVAHTEFDVLKRFNNYTLVTIKLLTGRTNQIRIHFNALGHPLVGDNLYTSNKIKLKNRTDLDRVFLHASHLSFKDLNNETQTFESKLPPKLQDILDKIK